MDTVLHRPNWVRRDRVHGLDPCFAYIDELIVVGGDLLFFLARLCDMLYFDDHYHSYVIKITPQQSIYTKLLHFEWADQKKHCANICHMAQVKP